MPTLNVSLPDQLKLWISEQVKSGHYSSASDYLRDLVRNDMREKEESMSWLSHHLDARMNTPLAEFEHVSADEIKKRARKQLKED